jgi:hypothetical protein
VGVKAIVLALLLAFAVAAPQAASAPSPVLVSFRQTGGFIGVERSVVVRRSGDVTAENVRVSKLSRAELTALRNALEAARWRTLRSGYAPEVHVSDGFLYAITYAGRTIHIAEGATLPRRLARPFVLLQRIAGLRS